MSDQASFGDFTDAEDAEDGDRPAAEAAAVAGDGPDSGASAVVTDDSRYPGADGTVAFAVSQVDYTVEGRGDEEYPVVHVFGRTPDGDREHVRVLEFEPYFYTPTAELDADPTETHGPVLAARERGPGGERFESIRGEALTKVVTRTPRDVGSIRDEFDTTYEADILFPNRFLIDRDIGGGVEVPARRLDDGRLQVHHTEVDPVEVDAELRVNTFDIEVDDRRGFPEDGEEPIVCLTSHDSYRDEYVLWLYEAPDATAPAPEGLPDYEQISGGADVELRSFPTESAMLDDFLAYLEATDPDVLTGWNFEDFDAPYLLDRLEMLDPDAEESLAVERLSRVDEVWRSGWGGPDVKGRVVFDLLYAYKRTQFTELESYRLDAVAELELDVGKERYSGDIGDLWEREPARLLAYNLRDVELCVEIDRKQSVITFWDEVRRFVGCLLEDAPTPGDAVDVYVLHNAHGRFALPTKGQQASEEFEGGAVFEPVTGVRENVTVLDLKSLYPMCMVSINASPETKVDPETHDGETYRAPNGTHFRATPDGMMREMVDELLTEREEKKSRRDEFDPGTDEYVQYDRQQAATKVIMNCFTPDTEVLTPDGVRKITELSVGDEVYSLDPETVAVEVKPVVETQAYPDYRGDLVDIETSQMDFRVTPNHRMLVRKDETNGVSWDGYRFVEAADLDRASSYQLPHGWTGLDGDRLDRVDLTNLVDDFEIWCDDDAYGHTLAAEVGWHPDTTEKTSLDTTGSVFDADEFDEHRGHLDDHCSRFRVRAERGRTWVPRFYDGDDFLDLLAWYITDGSVSTSETEAFDGQPRGSATTVQIARDAPGASVVTDGGDSDRAATGALLDRMGLDHDVDDSGYRFTARLLGRVLERTCGGDSAEKRIPDLVFDASREQKRRFLDVLIAGDGDRGSEGAWRYTTSSERLRDDVLRLCTHLGLTANYSRDGGSWRIDSPEDSQPSLRMHRSGRRSSADDGVYCVTVADNHTLLAGRNGRFQFVGQSLYGVSGWDRFRLYDKESAAAVTATGREVLSFTEDVAEEMEYQIAYGDSVTGDRPTVVRDPDGRVRILPVEELFDVAETRPDANVLITTDGGSDRTVSLGKERGSLDDWDALSVTDDGAAEWQPIEEVVRHETDGSVVRLRHELGESVTTRDHSYVTEEDGDLVETTPEAVTEPVRVPGVPAVEEAATVDVYEVLRGSEREYTDGRGSGDAPTGTERVHADDEWVWFGHEGARDRATTVRVQRYVDLDSTDGRGLVRLLAAYVTEGTVSTVETTDAEFGASIAGSRRAWLEGLREDYHRLFDGATAGITVSDSSDERTVAHESASGEDAVTDDETLTLQLRNELSAVFFREFAGQTRRKRLPSLVFHLPDDVQTLLLDTLVGGDGSRASSRHTDEDAERDFEFETTSRELAAGLSMLLTQRGQNHSLDYRGTTESYTVRTCDHDREGRDPRLTEVDHDGYVYDLSVAENENFVDAVGGIVLHNTDSVMLELGADVTKAEAVERSFEIEDQINDRYDDFARERLGATEHRFQIEFEKLYRRFFQAGKKKRYAGHIVWKEGKDVDDIDITGFEYKRSDIAQVTKRVQRAIIEMIVRGEDLDNVKQFLHEEITAFESGERSLADVGIPGGIGKRLDAYDTDTAQVRGARYANHLLGTNFGRGSKPKRVYLEKVHPEFFRRLEAEEGLDPSSDPVYAEFKRDPDVICFEYDDQIPDAFEVDWERMLEKTLQGPISRVIEALDMSWDEVRSGQTQTGLGQFG